MNIYRLSYPDSFAAAYSFDGPQVLAIGDFDGVHLGHREVLRTAEQLAGDRGQPCSVMTFDPHPRTILGQRKYDELLTPISEKMEVLKEQGLNRTYIMAFDQRLSRISPAQFVEEVLVAMGISEVVVGFDFRFGHQGQGSAELLKELGQGRFGVTVVPPFHLEGSKVSSTEIRDRLFVGDCAGAARLMGRPYRFCGTVVPGEGRGRLIGFPTANLQVAPGYLVPAGGVYAIRAFVAPADHPDPVGEGGRSGLAGLQPLNGVMNIGVKPTFAGSEPVQTIEAHLFDFAESIYGQSLCVELWSYLRHEMKFDSVDSLVDQIRRDAESAARLLEAETSPV